MRICFYVLTEKFGSNRDFPDILPMTYKSRDWPAIQFVSSICSYHRSQMNSEKIGERRGRSLGELYHYRILLRLF